MYLGGLPGFNDGPDPPPNAKAVGGGGIGSLGLQDSGDKGGSEEEFSQDYLGLTRYQPLLQTPKKQEPKEGEVLDS